MLSCVTARTVVWLSRTFPGAGGGGEEVFGNLFIYCTIIVQFGTVWLNIAYL